MIENKIPNPQRMMKNATTERLFLESESKFIILFSIKSKIFKIGCSSVFQIYLIIIPNWA